MKSRPLDPRRLDLAAWALDGHPVSGLVPIASLPRLAEGLAGVPQGDAAWSAELERVVLMSSTGLACRLRVDATVPLQCQRCLQAYVQTLTVHRRFAFARDEDEAQRLDDEIEDDVLVQERHLDLLALVEDELILALPIVPRHEVCPEPWIPPVDPGGTEESAPSPFAALAALKRGSGDDR